MWEGKHLLVWVPPRHNRGFTGNDTKFGKCGADEFRGEQNQKDVNAAAWNTRGVTLLIFVQVLGRQATALSETGAFDKRVELVDFRFSYCHDLLSPSVFVKAEPLRLATTWTMGDCPDVNRLGCHR